jgi:hypothetical protein
MPGGGLLAGLVGKGSGVFRLGYTGPDQDKARNEQKQDKASQQSGVAADIEEKVP